MPLPLLPLIGLGAAGAGAALMNDADDEQRKKSRAKDAAVDKYYKDTINERYGKKGEALSNRDMSSETEEAGMLGERATQKAAVADIANREAGLEASSLRNRDQARSFANKKTAQGMKKGGAVKMAKGGSVSSASKRADGCAVKGKTRGMMR
jgi:hypothetical protein